MRRNLDCAVAIANLPAFDADFFGSKVQDALRRLNSGIDNSKLH